MQDYCGLLSEEAVRKNCVLVYELLDEVIDNGFPQSTSSEALKEYVLNEPILVKSVVRPSFPPSLCISSPYFPCTPPCSMPPCISLCHSWCILILCPSSQSPSEPSDKVSNAIIRAY